MIIVEEDKVPEITLRQKIALVNAVRSGRLPWSETLMARAGLKYEEVFADGLLPPLIKAQHDVELGYVPDPEREDPADRYTIMIQQLAQMHGYDPELVTEKITTSETFKNRVNEVVKIVSEGGEVKIMLSDLDFLKE